MKTGSREKLSLFPADADVDLQTHAHKQTQRQTEYPIGLVVLEFWILLQFLPGAK